MTCEAAMERMSAALDGALSPAEAQALEAHLQSCPDCRALMDAMAEVDRQVAGLRASAPEGLKRGVLYRIDQAAGKAKPARRRRFGPGTAIGAVAAVLILLVGLGVFPGLKDRAASKADVVGRMAVPGEAEQIEAYGLLPELNAEDAFPQWDAANEAAEAPVDKSKGAAQVETAVPAATNAPETEADSYYLNGGDAETSREEARPLDEALRGRCAALSEDREALVLVYTEFSPESLFALLEAEEPALYAQLADLEPREEEGLIVYDTGCASALAIQEWLLGNLPQSEIMDPQAREAENRLMIRMEELDPGSGSLYRSITWTPRTSPILWPETWPEGWALRLRTEENWGLFFPEEGYVPAADKAACLVFPAA